MKQFLKTNTVTYNLMSFTGFKSLLIFSSLLEAPKSYKELRDILKNNEYLHEEVSTDTIRIYLNSLREIGCNIEKITENRVAKYYITNHPLKLKFSDNQIKSIIKAYKAISKSIQVSDLISIQKFFCKISDYVENEELKTKLCNISPIKNISPELIEQLISYTSMNCEVVLKYNSAQSGHKNIVVVPDKIHINNGKLYLSGYNGEHKNYSSFLVSKIIEIVDVNYNNKSIMPEFIKVGYEYKKDGENELQLLDCEQIIEQDNDKYLIEISSKNKFEIIQRILSHGTQCTVIYPQDFRQEIIKNFVSK